MTTFTIEEKNKSPWRLAVIRCLGILNYKWLGSPRHERRSFPGFASRRNDLVGLEEDGVESSVIGMLC